MNKIIKGRGDSAAKGKGEHNKDGEEKEEGLESISSKKRKKKFFKRRFRYQQISRRYVQRNKEAEVIQKHKL